MSKANVVKIIIINKADAALGHKVDLLTKEIKRMNQQVKDLQAEIAKQTTLIEDERAEVSTQLQSNTNAIAALEAKIKLLEDQLGTPLDLTAEIDAVKANNVAIAGIFNMPVPEPVPANPSA